MGEADYNQIYFLQNQVNAHYSSILIRSIPNHLHR